MRGKLTRRAIDGLQSTDRRPAFLWDGELRGFGLKVEPGGTRSFVLQYRTAERIKRRMVLGRHGVITLDQARDMARIALGKVAEGLDPSDETRAKREGKSVGAICDWYLEEATAGRLLGRKRVPIKPSTLYMDRSRIETHIRPLIGRRAVSALTLSDIEKMQIDIAEGKTARARGDGRGRATVGGRGAGARSVTTLHSIFNHAKRHGLIESNPAAGVRKFPESRRDRRLSRKELQILGSALREADAIEHPVGLAVIRLLALSGLRLNEAQALQRGWVAEDGFIAFPDTKSGAQTRAIGPAALALIAAQPGVDGNAHVFPSDGGRGHFIASDGVLGRVARRAGLEGLTAHVLRHTFASIAADLGFSELTIAALLGHAAGSVTSRYVHVDEAVRMAVHRVSDEIEMLLNGDVETARPSAAVFSIASSSLLAGGFAGAAGLITIRRVVTA